jgi:hypothetical protein
VRIGRLEMNQMLLDVDDGNIHCRKCEKIRLDVSENSAQK